MGRGKTPFEQNMNANTYNFSLREHVSTEANVLVREVDAADVLDEAANAATYDVGDRVGGRGRPQRALEVIEYLLLHQKQLSLISSLNRFYQISTQIQK